MLPSPLHILRNQDSRWQRTESTDPWRRGAGRLFRPPEGLLQAQGRRGAKARHTVGTLEDLQYDYCCWHVVGTKGVSASVCLLSTAPPPTCSHPAVPTGSRGQVARRMAWRVGLGNGWG